MTRDCEGPDCDTAIPSEGGRGTIIDPARADLPVFKLTHDAGVGESPRYLSPVFCSRDCMDAWMRENDAT